jgi:hypothetical protein
MHRGRAEVTASPLGGACFRLELHHVQGIPLAGAAYPPASREEISGPPVD